MRIVTHNARFHTDDVFAAAVLLELHPRAELVRTRDKKIIEAADVAFDVGDIYDAEKNRFDHHQKGGAGKRDNDVPYASFGLVWKTFGAELCAKHGAPAAAVGVIDRKLVQPVDATDNGINLYTPKIEGLYPYVFQTMTFSFNPSWKEDENGADAAFMEMVAFARKLLVREIVQARDKLEGESFVRAAYEAAEDKRIIVLDKNYPWAEILTIFPEPLYVVRPNVQTKDWKVEAVPVMLLDFKTRKPLPEAWAGKRDGDLAATTGVSDAHFCHNGRFLIVARSKEGALELARIAADAR